MKTPKTKPTYRGELLPALATLTDQEIADRLREAVAMDQTLHAQLDEMDDDATPAQRAVIRAYRALLDLALASIAVAEHRVEVQLFTLPVPAKPKKGRRD